MGINDLSIRKLSYLPRIALLLYAIDPILANYDWAFFVNSVLIILLFILSIIGYGKIYTKNKAYFLKSLIGNTAANIYDLIVAIIGIALSYYMHFDNRAYFWWFVLIFAIVELLFPTKIIVKNKERA